MSLSMHRGDELPAWDASITLNGEAIDFSTGWDFTVTLSRPGEDTIEKTDGITGLAGGAQVQWATGELDIAVGTWRVQLTGTRSSDDAQFTIDDSLYIKPRVLGEGS